MKMSMEHWWHDTDRGKPKYSEKSLFHCHFVHHKSYKDLPGIEHWPPLNTLKKVEVPYHSIVTDFRKSIAFERFPDFAHLSFW
jgi:hypothetical protein